MSTDTSAYLRALQESQELAIGVDFAKLLRSLPLTYQAWDSRWFSGAMSVPRSYRTELCGRASMRACPEAHALSKYGLTPAILYRVNRGLTLLFNRIERQGALHLSSAPPSSHEESSLPMAVYLNFGPARPWVFLPQALLLAEVAATPDLPAPLTIPVLRWLLAVLRLQPGLIAGYVGHIEANSLVFEHRPAAKPAPATESWFPLAPSSPSPAPHPLSE